MIGAAAKNGITTPMTLVGAEVRDKLRLVLKPDVALDIRFSKCAFSGPFVVWTGVVEVSKCKLQFDQVRFVDLVDLGCLPIAKELRFRRCRCERSVQLSGIAPQIEPVSVSGVKVSPGERNTVEQWDRHFPSRNLAFLECQFFGSLDLKLLGRIGEISFADSTFKPRSSVSIDLRKGHLQKLTLSNVHLQGRFDIISVSATSGRGPRRSGSYP